MLKEALKLRHEPATHPFHRGAGDDPFSEAADSEPVMDGAPRSPRPGAIRRPAQTNDPSSPHHQSLSPSLFGRVSFLCMYVGAPSISGHFISTNFNRSIGDKLHQRKGGGT